MIFVNKESEWPSLSWLLWPFTKLFVDKLNFYLITVSFDSLHGNFYEGERLGCALLECLVRELSFECFPIQDCPKHWPESTLPHSLPTPSPLHPPPLSPPLALHSASFSLSSFARGSTWVVQSLGSQSWGFSPHRTSQAHLPEITLALSSLAVFSHRFTHSTGFYNILCMKMHARPLFSQTHAL